MGTGQIVYGTDIPFNWPVTVDLVLEAPFLDDAGKEAIWAGTSRSCCESICRGLCTSFEEALNGTNRHRLLQTCRVKRMR